MVKVQNLRVGDKIANRTWSGDIATVTVVSINQGMVTLQSKDGYTDSIFDNLHNSVNEQLTKYWIV